MRWRQNVKHQLESGHSVAELRYWSEIALKYGFGLPGKMQTETTRRVSLVFATTDGKLPWEARTRMDDKTDAMIAAKEQEEKLLALEAKKPVVIDAKANTGDTSAEELESLETVVPPPADDPSAFR